MDIVFNMSKVVNNTIIILNYAWIVLGVHTIIPLENLKIYSILLLVTSSGIIGFIADP